MIKQIPHLLLALLATLLLATSAAASTSLSKDDLRRLATQKVDSEVILGLVRAQCVDFEVDADAMIELDELLSSEVLTEIIECSRSRQTAKTRDLRVAPDVELKPRTVVVLPFTGDPRFRDLAADTMIDKLTGEPGITVIHPDRVRQLVVDVEGHSASDSISIGAAQTVAADVRAELVLMGNISSRSDGMTLNSMATVKLIDTRTGEVLASAQKKSGKIFASGEMSTARAAAKRATMAILPALKERIADGR